MSDMKDAKNGNGYNAEEAWAHKENQEKLKKMKDAQGGQSGGQASGSDKGDGKDCGDNCKGGHKGACKKKAGCSKCDANAKK